MTERSPYKKQLADPKKIFCIILSGALIVCAFSIFYYFVISRPKLDAQKMNIERLKQENKKLELMKVEGKSQPTRHNEGKELISEPEIEDPVRADAIDLASIAQTPKEQDMATRPLSTSNENEIKTTPLDKRENETISIYEERRQRGLAQFEREVIQLAKKADQMDIEYRRYKDSCMNQSTYVYSYGRSWFSVWDGYTYISNESLPECRKIWSDFVRLTEEIKAGMVYSMDLARRAGVYPGQVRKVREKYYLDWEGWEKE